MGVLKDKSEFLEFFYQIILEVSVLSNVYF